MLKNLSTIHLTLFLARKKEALRLPAPMESGHTPFFISLIGLRCQSRLRGTSIGAGARRTAGTLLFHIGDGVVQRFAVDA